MGRSRFQYVRCRIGRRTKGKTVYKQRDQYFQKKKRKSGRLRGEADFPFENFQKKKVSLRNGGSSPRWCKKRKEDNP